MWSTIVSRMNNEAVNLERRKKKELFFRKIMIILNEIWITDFFK